MGISQDSKDWFIFNLIVNFFKCGKVYNEARGISKFRLTQKNEIIDLLIPYFNKYPLQGRKALQFSA